jgi:hypothetical protein
MTRARVVQSSVQGGIHGQDTQESPAEAQGAESPGEEESEQGQIGKARAQEGERPEGVPRTRRSTKWCDADPGPSEMLSL